MRLLLANWALTGLILTSFALLWLSFGDGQSQNARKEALLDSIASHARLTDQTRKHEAELERARIKAVADSNHATHDEMRGAGFAYVFYATQDAYACSVLVNIHRLVHQLDTKVPIHVLITASVSEKYQQALKAAEVTLHVEEPPPLSEEYVGGAYYLDCLLKLLAFKMHTLDPSLKRILIFDGDQIILRNLDHLFTGLPAIDLAAPRAYWVDKAALASTFMVIDLSDRLWAVMRDALGRIRPGYFDMDLVNELLGDTVMMLSSEYATLNSHWEDWNLPKWYHIQTDVNLTTVDEYNRIVKQQQLASNGKVRRRSGVQRSVLSSGSSLRRSDNATLTSNSTLPFPSSPQSLARPRFPSSHPIFTELTALQGAASVIHFTAVGKPWTYTQEQVRIERPDAHPLLFEQFGMWRETAMSVCPPGAIASV